MTDKRKKNIRELAASLGIRRRAAASRLDAGRSEPAGGGGRAPATGAAYSGPRGEAAPPVSLRELYACVAAGVVTCDGDSGGWKLVEPPPGGADVELVARCRSAPYVEAMEKNDWAPRRATRWRRIARDVGAAYAESVRRGTPALCSSAAPTPPTVPAPGERVQAIDQFQSRSRLAQHHVLDGPPHLLPVPHRSRRPGVHRVGKGESPREGRQHDGPRADPPRASGRSGRAGPRPVEETWTALVSFGTPPPRSRSCSWGCPAPRPPSRAVSRIRRSHRRPPSKPLPGYLPSRWLHAPTSRRSIPS